MTGSIRSCGGLPKMPSASWRASCQRTAAPRWSDADKGCSSRPSPGRPTIAGLGLARRAIDERRVTRLVYHAFRREQPDPRDVEPIRLVHLSDAWHLAAYCRLRQGARLFRLDRIDRLELLDERYTPGARHAMAARDERDVTAFPEARIRFDQSVLRWVRERQPFVLLREDHDEAGPIFVYAVRDEQELLTWLLPWGAVSGGAEPRLAAGPHGRRGAGDAGPPHRTRVGVRWSSRAHETDPGDLTRCRTSDIPWQSDPSFRLMPFILLAS